MRWGIKYSETYATACDAYELFKDQPDYQLPAAIAEKPELGTIDIYYLNEFHTLGTERVNAMAEGAIPVTRIRQRALQIGDDDIEMFEEIILKVDRAYLTMRYEESEKKSKAKGNK